MIDLTFKVKKNLVAQSDGRWKAILQVCPTEAKTTFLKKYWYRLEP